jgi:branched-chain amino acid transport system ATP-binding protein
MLEISNLSVRYGRHQALDGVSAKIDKGEVCVILGANGAGKSSLLKAIAGIVRAEPSSRIVMNGVSIAGMKTHKIVERGIALVPEGRGIFGELTVAENLQLGAFPGRARSLESATLASVYALFPRLAERRSQMARTMSGGEQQMVAIGRALMSQPEILMLDEPSLGLSPALMKELFRSLARIAETGVGILLVEQNARQSLKIASRGYLIEVGRLTGENSAQNLMTDPAVVSAYLGGAAKRPEAKPIRLPAPLRLPGDLASIGLFMSGLASRAGAIQQAFVRSLRQAAVLPSAFVGRYDPAKDKDPWDELAARVQPLLPASRPAAGAAVLRTAVAADLARAAAQRHARHIRTLRASRENPSAFAGVYDPATALISLDPLDPRGLANAAADRWAEHVRRQRAARPLPSAFVRAPTAQVEPESAPANLGHNSRGVDIDAEDAQAVVAVAATRPLDIDALVARAAQIHSSHVAQRRKLTITNLKPEDLSGTGKPKSR